MRKIMQTSWKVAVGVLAAIVLVSLLFTLYFVKTHRLISDNEYQNLKKKAEKMEQIEENLLDQTLKKGK